MVNENEIISKPNAIIRLSLIGAFLTVVNTIAATLALGVFQGFIVAFTTPFAFAFGRLLYPKMPAATILYIPVVIVSIFTLNFGPPGHYKIFFILSAFIYDLTCYILMVHKVDKKIIPLWKLIIPTILYPIGLLISAFVIIKFFTVELPILSKGWTGAIMLLIFFAVMGSLATFVAHRVFYRWIHSAEK